MMSLERSHGNGNAVLAWFMVLLVMLVGAAAGSNTTTDGLWLAALYNSSGGGTIWSRLCRTGWDIMKPDQVCIGNTSLWHGISCNAASRVTRVSLNNCRLAQATSLPDVLDGAMTAVESIDLSNNKALGASLPGSWSAMTSLRSLDIVKSGLTGSLPSSWSSFWSLSHLSLAYNHLSDNLPDAWALMAPIAYLDLSGNMFDGPLPETWHRIPALTTLLLSGNSFSGSLPDAWSSFPSLSILFLRNASLRGTLPDTWRTFSPLQQFNGENNSFNGTLPSSWSQLPSLQVLLLSGNNFSLGSLPESYASLLSLTWISLEECSIRGSLPESWSSLSAVESISLRNNRIEGSLPDSWSSMRNLTVLSLDGNSLVSTLPSSWSALRVLRILNLDRNRLASSLPPSWSSMSSLDTLTIGEAQVYGILPDGWATGMKSLSTLDLHKNNLTGGLPRSWSSFPYLEALTLDENNLSGSLLASLPSLLGNFSIRSNALNGSIPNAWFSDFLFEIHLDNNRLHGSLPAEWSSQISPLQVLTLNSNSVVGSLPPEWNEFPSLTELSLKENHLRGTLPSSWSYMSALSTLTLSNNSLSGTLPPSWSDISTLQVLDLSHNRFHGAIPFDWFTPLMYWPGLVAASVQFNCISLSSDSLSENDTRAPCSAIACVPQNENLCSRSISSSSYGGTESVSHSSSLTDQRTAVSLSLSGSTGTPSQRRRASQTSSTSNAAVTMSTLGVPHPRDMSRTPLLSPTQISNRMQRVSLVSNVGGAATIAATVLVSTLSGSVMASGAFSVAMLQAAVGALRVSSRCASSVSAAADDATPQDSPGMSFFDNPLQLSLFNGAAGIASGCILGNWLLSLAASIALEVGRRAWPPKLSNVVLLRDVLEALPGYGWIMWQLLLQPSVSCSVLCVQLKSSSSPGAFAMGMFGITVDVIGTGSLLLWLTRSGAAPLRFRYILEPYAVERRWAVVVDFFVVVSCGVMSSLPENNSSASCGWVLWTMLTVCAISGATTIVFRPYQSRVDVVLSLVASLMTVISISLTVAGKTDAAAVTSSVLSWVGLVPVFIALAVATRNFSRRVQPMMPPTSGANSATRADMDCLAPKPANEVLHRLIIAACRRSPHTTTYVAVPL